jgi:TrpR family trp operon transcriptional repressor
MAECGEAVMIKSGDSDAALRELAAVLSRMDGASEVYEVLYALLTARERDKIALRWKLVGLLEEGVSQRAIAAELGISLCKITRGSHELKYGPAGFRKAIRRAVKQKRQG